MATPVKNYRSGGRALEQVVWALEEKGGARKGKLVGLPYVPFWYPIKTAIFDNRQDAIRYVKNTRSEGKYKIIQIIVKIERAERMKNDPRRTD